MAHRHESQHPVVQLEYGFDRLLDRKLEQAYCALVPEQVRSTGLATKIKEKIDEDCSNLRASIVRQTTGRQHNCQSGGRIKGVRSGQGVRSAQ